MGEKPCQTQLATSELPLWDKHYVGMVGGIYVLTDDQLATAERIADAAADEAIAAKRNDVAVQAIRGATLYLTKVQILDCDRPLDESRIIPV